jgi:hypothetical protein
MSRREWERGELKVSGKEFVSIRRDMVAFVNQRQVRLYEKAQTCYQWLKNAGKGKRGYDYQLALASFLSDDTYHEIFHVIFPYEKVLENGSGAAWKHSRKPKAPKKKSFAPLKQNVERINVGREASIGFDRKTRTIHWSTGENNHAVDSAREHAIGREFFKRLSRVVWTRGTGGEIIGNDEYNEESGHDHAGSGGSYVTARYGNAEKQFRKSLGVR